jgi:hypothetical protein
MATRNLLAALDNKLVQVAIAAARPTTALHGVDVTSWRTGVFFSSQMAALLVDGDQAMTIASPTGGALGVELWGYRLAQWWRIGYLNDGASIDIAGNLQGYAAEVDIIGIFDRIAVAGTPNVGAAIAKLIPIESWS